MTYNIKINSALTDQVESLLNELDFRFQGDEIIAYTELKFKTLTEVNTAFEVIANHFGDSAILGTEIA